MKSYKGDEPYVFISYAHNDSEMVFPVIKRLIDEHYRVWYDEGIDPGTEWDEFIAEKVDRCGFFIAMMSRQYIDSDNCRDELYYARELNKKRLLIYLEDIELPSGMTMRLGRLQSIFKYKYDDENLFYEKLWSTADLSTCLIDNQKFDSVNVDNTQLQKADSLKTQSPHSQHPKGEIYDRKNSIKKLVRIGAILLMLGGSILIYYHMRGNVQNDKETTSLSADTSSSVLSPSYGTRTITLEASVDSHILLKLSNADHQYDMGLENWRRLDYNRAERDILNARNIISEEKAQNQEDIATINNSLGCLYLDMGRYAEAYDYLNAAFVYFRNQYGDNGVKTRAVRASIAKYYYYTGKWETALGETQYIIDNTEADSEQAIYVGTLHIRAMIVEAQGRFEEALGLYQQILEQYNEILQEGQLRQSLSNYATDPELNQTEKDYITNSLKWIAYTYGCISKTCIQCGDNEKAIAASSNGIKICEQNIYIGKRNLTTARLYRYQAEAEGNMSDFSEAIDHIDLAMRIERNLFDFEDVFPGLIEVQVIYGNLLSETGDIQKAKEYFNNAVSLALNTFGENHPDTAVAFGGRGDFLLKIGLVDESINDLNQAIEIRKNILAKDHPDTAGLYYSLAKAHYNKMDYDSTRECIKEALKICENWQLTGNLIESIKKLSDILPD